MTRLEIMERWPVWFLRRVLAMRTFDREKPQLSPGLPDDIFSNQKSYFGKNALYLYLYFMVIWSVLQPFGIFYGRWVHLMAF
jgi:hypothetical protein